MFFSHSLSLLCSCLRFVVAVGAVVRSSRGFSTEAERIALFVQVRMLNFCCLSHEMNHFDYYTSPRSRCVHKASNNNVLCTESFPMRFTILQNDE